MKYSQYVCSWLVFIPSPTLTTFILLLKQGSHQKLKMTLLWFILFFPKHRDLLHLALLGYSEDKEKKPLGSNKHICAN